MLTLHVNFGSVCNRWQAGGVGKRKCVNLPKPQKGQRMCAVAVDTMLAVQTHAQRVCKGCGKDMTKTRFAWLKCEAYSLDDVGP